jgi:hypothetical protein
MKIDNVEVYELPYHITVNDVPFHETSSMLGLIVDFMEQNGHPVLNRTMSHCTFFDSELTTYGGLKDDQLFEYYNCQAGEKFRVFYYRYFTNGGGPHDYFGVMVVLDDQVLAMQLKLMLS